MSPREVGDPIHASVKNMFATVAHPSYMISIFIEKCIHSVMIPRAMAESAGTLLQGLSQDVTTLAMWAWRPDGVGGT